MDTGFFKWVWRFNAMALAGLLIFVGVIALLELLPRSHSVANVINVDPGDETLVETLKIGSVTPINGLIRYSVGREQSFDAGYSSGKTTRNNTANYGYLDPATGSVRWLLDGFDALILETVALQEETDTAVSGRFERDPSSETLASLYVIVDRDTSGDNRLSRSDIGRIALSLPDGTDFKVILTDVHVFRGVQRLYEKRYMIRFKNGDGEQVAILDVDAREVEKTLTLPLE